jgi:NTP pyrophosphatase (non-canonical NTP hydrolase)
MKVLVEFDVPDDYPDAEQFVSECIDSAAHYNFVVRPLTSRLTFEELSKANATRKIEWHGENNEQWGLVDWSNELAGETGETCDVVKKIRRVDTGVTRRGPRSRDALFAALRLEIADVVICADLLCSAAGFNLGAAVAQKFNATSEKHGLGTVIQSTG